MFRTPCMAGHPGHFPHGPLREISFPLPLAILGDYLGKSRPLHVFTSVDTRAQGEELSVCVWKGPRSRTGPRRQ